MRSCTVLLGQVRPSEKHFQTIQAEIMEVCSFLLTAVQKKTSQQELSMNGILWGSSFKNVLLWQAFAPVTSAVLPGITQWAASPRR